MHWTKRFAAAGLATVFASSLAFAEMDNPLGGMERGNPTGRDMRDGGVPPGADATTTTRPMRDDPTGGVGREDLPDRGEPRDIPGDVEAPLGGGGAPGSRDVR